MCRPPAHLVSDSVTELWNCRVKSLGHGSVPVSLSDHFQHLSVGIGIRESHSLSEHSCFRCVPGSIQLQAVLFQRYTLHRVHSRKEIKVATVFRTVLFVPLLATANEFAQGTHAMESGLWSVQPAPEIQHARDAALAVYPNRATRLDLPPLTPEEQEAIIAMVNDPAQMYVGIGRSVHLLSSNWAMVKQEDGFEVWQAQLHSPAALFLQVCCVDFNLASGMAVKVYSIEDSSSAHVWEYSGRGPEDGGAFWSLAVPGDTMVVEYWRPTGNQAKPKAFPFSIARISHIFRDEQGDVVGLDFHHFQARQENSCFSSGRKICTNSPTSSESTNVLTVSKGIARYQVNNSTGTSWRCSGSLLNNETKDQALYFLTAWHCVGPRPQLRNPENATTAVRLGSLFEFWANQCNTTALYIRGMNSNFVAGSEEGDWALLRIDGVLTFLGSGQQENGMVGFLGWNSATLDDFDGFVVHHGGGDDQGLATFEGEDLSFLSSPDSGFFPKCTGRNVPISRFVLMVRTHLEGFQVLPDFRMVQRKWQEYTRIVRRTVVVLENFPGLVKYTRMGGAGAR